jgi:hypothetical protein
MWKVKFVLWLFQHYITKTFISLTLGGGRWSAVLHGGLTPGKVLPMSRIHIKELTVVQLAKKLLVFVGAES